MERIVRIAALLHADDGQDGNDFGNLDSAGEPQAEDSAARQNFSAANADLRAAKSSVQKSGDNQQIRQPEENKKQSRRVLQVHQVNHRTPDHGDKEQNQGAAGIPEWRKIKLGAARTYRNDNFRMRRLRDLAGVRVARLR